MSDIAERVAKLLSLAAEDSGATDAEREQAAERAQKLMVEHRLSKADVDAARGKVSNAQIEMRPYWGTPPLRRNRWVYQLAVAVATINDCEAVYVGGEWGKPGPDIQICLVGESETIEFVHRLVDFIHPQVMRVCLAELEREVGVRMMMSKPVDEDWADDYGLGVAYGAVERIATRLIIAKNEAVGPGNALVLSREQAIKDFYGEHQPERREDKTKVDLWAAHRGSEGAASIDLNPDNKLAGSTPALTQGDH